MALKGMEDWDIFDDAHILNYWQSAGGTITAGAGRCGSAASYHSNNQINAIGVTTAVSSGYAAYAFKPETTGTAGNFLIGNTTGLAPGDTLAFGKFTGAGIVEFWSGPNTVLGTKLAETAAGAFNFGVYSQFGFEWNLSAAGYMRIYINGVLAADSGVANTLNIWSGGQWGTLGFAGFGYTDDYYWGDTTGVAPWNAYMGDQHIQGQIANQPGFYQEWTPLTGSNHVAMVNQNPPDDGTTYNWTDVVGLKETYTFPPIIPLQGVVTAIMSMPNMEKSAFRTRVVRNMWRSGSTSAFGVNQALAAGGYRYYPEMAEVDPVTGLAWTVASANAVEQGMESVS